MTGVASFDQRVSQPTRSAPPVRARRRVTRSLNAFTTVRIRGLVTTQGAYITLLSVNAPRGARVLVRCKGSPSCPTSRSTARTARVGRLLTFRRFHRRHLRAGARIEVLVTKRGYLGKYTRFRIRAKQAPGRVDLCLSANRRPGRCR